ncbi:MAG: helix-turn-helix domain-containing protein [Dongiaceae bacterium]
MGIPTIKTDAHHRYFRAELDKLAAQDPDPASGPGVHLELLAKVVEDYEKNRYIFDKPDPIDAIRFRMEQQGLRQKDIAPFLGGKNRVSEVLSRKRSLTKHMIHALYERLDIPLELLMREPKAEYKVTRAIKRPARNVRRNRSVKK